MWRVRNWASSPALLPGLALLSWACLLPFLGRIDAILLSAGGWRIAAIYGTAFVTILPLALAPAVALKLAGFLAGLAASRPKAERVSAFLGHAGFFLVLLYAIKLYSVELARLHELELSHPAWKYFILAASAVFALLSLRKVSNLFGNLVGVSRAIALLGLICAPLALLQPDSEPPPGKAPLVRQRPDLVLITLDALSARQMGLYGAPVSNTPNLSAFGARAMVFDRAYAGGNFTTVGVNSLLTGAYPSQTRAMHLVPRAHPKWRGESLPALLDAAGYRTAYAVSNPNAGPIRNGYRRYFDEGRGDLYRGRRSLCEDRLAAWLPYHCYLANPFVEAALTHLTRFGRGNQAHDPEPILRAASAMLNRGARPLFLWAHFWQPHDPYAAPAPWSGKYDASPAARDARSSMPAYQFAAAREPSARIELLQARYRESIAWGDAAAGQLIAEVERRLGDNVAIIVTADHGESFSDGWGGHGGRLLNEDVIRIPLILKMPGSQTGRRIATPTSQVDLKAIVLAILAGADGPAIEQLIATRRRAEPVFSMAFIDNEIDGELREGAIAAIGPTWKYVLYPNGFDTPSGHRTHEWAPLGARPDPKERAWLVRAVAEHLRRWGGPGERR